MKVRAFKNSDVLEICKIFETNPDCRTRCRVPFYDQPSARADAPKSNAKTPPSFGYLEGAFFSSPGFSSESLFVVCDESASNEIERDRPIAFAVASFAPNEKRDGLDPKTGVVYPPVFALRILDDASKRRFAAELLFAATENYFRNRGVENVYVGGFPTGSPFFSGVYSPCSPPGLYDDDPDVELFQSRGYEPEEIFYEYRLALDDYEAPFDLAFRDAQVRYFSSLGRFPDVWKSRFHPFDVGIYTYFTTQEWLVRSSDKRILGGALTRKPQLGVDAKPSDPLRVELSFLAVQRDFARRRVGSVLLAEIVKRIRAAHSRRPVEFYAVVPETKTAYRGFLEANSFSASRRFVSRRKKILDL